MTNFILQPNVRTSKTQIAFNLCEIHGIVWFLKLHKVGSKMPTDLISPPYEELRSLAEPLTEGEWFFLEWLRKNLSSDWEIYVQPYMNGLRPDFVLLSPRKGIAVYEVKDWDLSAIQYHYEGDPPKLFGIKSGKRFTLGEQRDPVAKIHTYKSEIFNLYCPSLGRKHGFGAIVGGIVFPFSPTDRIEDLLRPAREHYGLLAYPKHNLVVGSDLLTGEVTDQNLKRILPVIYSINQEMSECVADDLRHWLAEPEQPKDQRHNAFNDLDKKQKEIVTTRTNKGGRRVHGPAGSGKTLVLCGRTARLVGEGKKVLLITFNITLLNYLRDTIARFFVGTNTSRRWVAKQYEIMNFHHFCSRLADATGNREAYRQIWRRAYGNSSIQEELLPDDLEAVLAKTLPELALNWANELPEEEKYDAIFVDEAQDLKPEWWEVLIRCKKQDGEAMLAADRTQNVYSVDQTWAKSAVKGFRGPWTDLSVSYRLPPEVTAEARRFIDRYIPSPECAKPETLEPLLEAGLFSTDQDSRLATLQWINTSSNKDEKIKACLSAMELMIRESESSSVPLNYADLTFLVESEEIGVALSKAISDLGIRVINTFDTDSSQARRKKMAFRKGDGRVKITTVFSYKGWETSALILQISQGRTERDHALFYTGLTRLKVSRPQSYLTVVNSAPEYRAFGEAWPNN
jgi:hypothetical protein